MKNEIISIQIRTLIESIKDQQDLVLAHEGKIPQIELDILLGNVRKLYESLLALNKINEIPAVPVTPTMPESKPEPQHFTHSTDELIAHISAPVQPSFMQAEKFQEPSPVEGKVEIINEEPPVPTPAVSKSHEHQQPETLIAMVETPVEVPPTEIANEAVMPQASLARERTKEYSRKTAQTASLFDDHPTLAEKFQSGPSIYDKISAAKSDSSLADKHLKTPVSDLKKSIGINEKFAFINELFDGDLNSYNEAIDKLNNSSSFNQALTHLESNYATKYNWNGESESYLKLKNLVERRFGV